MSYIGRQEVGEIDPFIALEWHSLLYGPANKPTLIKIYQFFFISKLRVWLWFRLRSDDVFPFERTIFHCGINICCGCQLDEELNQNHHHILPQREILTDEGILLKMVGSPFQLNISWPEVLFMFFFFFFILIFIIFVYVQSHSRINIFNIRFRINKIRMITFYIEYIWKHRK